MSSIYNWEQTDNFSPYNWEKSGDFSSEQAARHDNVVRLEDWRVVRDHITGRDTDGELMILPRQLGLDKGASEKSLKPNLVPIDDWAEDQSAQKNGSVKYPLIAIGGLGAIAATQITRMIF